MKEEGFVNKALHIIKDEDMSARWLANQSLFNGADDSEVQLSAKVSVSFALNTYNDGYNDLDELMEKAIKITTIGEIRQVITDAEKIMKNREE